MKTETKYILIVIISFIIIILVGIYVHKNNLEDSSDNCNAIFEKLEQNPNINSRIKNSLEDRWSDLQCERILHIN